MAFRNPGYFHNISKFFNIQNASITVICLLFVDLIVSRYFTNFYAIIVKYIGPSILLLLSITCLMNVAVAKTNSKRLTYLILLMTSTILLMIKYYIPFYFKN